MGTTTPQGKLLKQGSAPSASAAPTNASSSAGASLSPPATGSSSQRSDTSKLGPRKICPGCGGRKAQHSILCLTCHKAGAPAPVKLRCTSCGGPFTRSAAEAAKQEFRNAGANTFCSRACYNEWREVERPGRKDRGFCVTCNKPLEGGDQKKYCSPVCYQARRIEGGRQHEYSGKFLALRGWIAQRDDRICQCCGKKSARMAVHHIDHNEGNHDPFNLVLLCQKCHVWYHNLLETSRAALAAAFKGRVVSSSTSKLTQGISSPRTS